jgi:fermentation-respiration switch protein FrsA (DUF1100 family)
MLSAASAAKVPVMFIQAENDADTTPSRALAATMAAAGKPHRLKLFPKFGQTTTDGHNFGYFGSKVWGQDLFDFFNSAMMKIRGTWRNSWELGEAYPQLPPTPNRG